MGLAGADWMTNMIGTRADADPFERKRAHTELTTIATSGMAGSISRKATPLTALVNRAHSVKSLKACLPRANARLLLGTPA